MREAVPVRVRIAMLPRLAGAATREQREEEEEEVGTTAAQSVLQVKTPRR